MPKLSKKAISLFIRTGCYRQFALYLYNDKERNKYGMATRQASRFALTGAAAEGDSWQFKKTEELIKFYGESDVIHKIEPGKIKFDKVQLKAESAVLKVKLSDESVVDILPFQFIVEANFQADTETFKRMSGLTGLQDIYNDSLTIGDARPDLIQVLPAISDFDKLNYSDTFLRAVTYTGEVVELAQDDHRTRLRIIDIKLASEPGAHYYAEVVYYSLTLAAWLYENLLDNQFVVVDTPAVWPGSHEASEVSKQMTDWRNAGYKPTPADITYALERDFETAPYDVFAPRLFRIFSVEIPYILSNTWHTLEWHVTPKCKGCEFLGFQWLDKDGNPTQTDLHCLPTAEQTNALCRVPGLTKSAAKYLRSPSIAIADTLSLGRTSVNSPLLNNHQSLRAKRTTFPYRASELNSTVASIIPNSGSDALMPRWPDLHIYLFLDYDLSSAISVAFCIRAFWNEPYDITIQNRKHLSGINDSRFEETFLIESRSLDRERTEFLRFLHTLKGILNAVDTEDKNDQTNGRRNTNSTYQIYFWDTSQQKHLIKLISRHLPHILADQRIKNLAWLFPSPELLSHPEDAARNSPFTYVETVVSNTVAAPIPFHYNLVELVQHYHRAGANVPSFHPLYEEPFSDLMPAERINDVWGRGKNWKAALDLIEETIEKKTNALRLIVQRLEDDLKPLLSNQSAPLLQRPDRSGDKLSTSPYSQMLYEFTRLNNSLARLETETIRSMPIHEREAKFKSARLTRRLVGQGEVSARSHFSNLLGHPLPMDAIIYELSSASCDVNIRNGAINFHLSPEDEPEFLDRKVLGLTHGTPLADPRHKGQSVLKVGLTEVSVIAIDRGTALIALQPGYKNQIAALEAYSIVDFSTNVVLDHLAVDYLSKKVNLTLQAIGHPAVANIDVQAFNTLGVIRKAPKKISAATTASEFLWEMSRLAATSVSRNISGVEAGLKSKGISLNNSQWGAWREALTKRASLIWGPPGTGKSKTLRVIILGAILDALEQRTPLRLLITSNTYTAIDNVLLEVDNDISKYLSGASINLVRIKSELRSDENVTINHPNILDLVLDKQSPSPDVISLLNSLNQQSGIVIVGTNPHQLHNLSQVGVKDHKSVAQTRDATLKPFFDLVLIDEASQLDVAMATLVFSKIAPNGSCVMAGDDLQLPPIHPADAPEGFENLLGSVYSFAQKHHGIVPKDLEINYRSSDMLVELTKMAGYKSSLTSYSPDLRISLATPMPTTKPINWPATLHWSPDLTELANPNSPVVAFTYDDDISSQVNSFEADTIAALTWLYRTLLTDRLENERDHNGTIKLSSTSVYFSQDFWSSGIGIVTPHRAQMSMIVSRLQQTFPQDNADLIRKAVDTVERFQGQQRDIIIASYGLGDPDLIGGEEEFLYNRNRFNVLASRARAKLIVLATNSLVNHLPNDGDVLEESRFMKRFFESFCSKRKDLTLDYANNGIVDNREGVMRFR
ncbi:DNA2/NAM7 family helicase [Fibrella sp. USSR17]